MDKLVPDDPDENEEEYNRAELSALVRIQYEERIKAQRQRDLANALSERGGLSPPSATRRKSSNRVQHMANHLNAEKQRRNYDEFQTKSTRRWRRLKEEIMTAADERSQADGSYDGPTHHKRVSSGGLQYLLEQITPFTSPSSAYAESITPAHEQIAPPLDHTEVRVVEGALNLKTMCALDVYTPLRMIFSIPGELLYHNIAEKRAIFYCSVFTFCFIISTHRKFDFDSRGK